MDMYPSLTNSGSKSGSDRGNCVFINTDSELREIKEALVVGRREEGKGGSVDGDGTVKGLSRDGGGEGEIFDLKYKGMDDKGDNMAELRCHGNTKNKQGSYYT